MIKYLLICLCCVMFVSCKTTGEHYLRNAETGKLELVEYIEMRGTAQHEIEFATEGKAKADSGFRVPDFPIDKIDFDK